MLMGNVSYGPFNFKQKARLVLAFWLLVLYDAAFSVFPYSVW